MSWLLVAAAAHAQTLAEVTDGQTLLAPCLANVDCEGWLRPLLSETMLEQGLALQHDPMVTSALIGRGYGVVGEFGMDVLTTGAHTDDTGNPTSLSVIPVMPRLGVGYHIGSYTYDDPYPQIAFGASILPPVGFGSFSVFSWGLNASAALPVISHVVWLGVETNYTRSVATARLFGSPDDLDRLGPLAGLVDPNIAGECTEEDCVDTFTVSAPAVRAGLALDPVPEVLLFVRGGGAWIRHDLDIDYDGTTWQQAGFQPQVHYGAALRVFDRAQLSVGYVMAFKTAELGAQPTPATVSKLDLSLSFRFGDQRYWDNKEPAEPLPGSVYQVDEAP